MPALLPLQLLPAPSTTPLPLLLLLAPLPLLIGLVMTWLLNMYMSTELLWAIAWEVVGVLPWAAISAAS